MNNIFIKNLALAITFFSLSFISQNKAYSMSLEKKGIITADAQRGSTEADLKITRDLRRKIMENNQLSTKAHNIQIITKGRAITLRGDVSSRAERIKIEAMARAMDSKKEIYNQLTY